MTLKEINFWNWFVSKLPAKLVYFCFMRVWHEGTSGDNADRNPDKLTCGHAVTIFSKANNIEF